MRDDRFEPVVSIVGRSTDAVPAAKLQGRSQRPSSRVLRVLSRVLRPPRTSSDLPGPPPNSSELLGPPRTSDLLGPPPRDHHTANRGQRAPFRESLKGDPEASVEFGACVGMFGPWSTQRALSKTRALKNRPLSPSMLRKTSHKHPPRNRAAMCNLRVAQVVMCGIALLVTVAARPVDLGPPSGVRQRASSLGF